MALAMRSISPITSWPLFRCIQCTFTLRPGVSQYQVCRSAELRTFVPNRFANDQIISARGDRFATSAEGSSATQDQADEDLVTERRVLWPVLAGYLLAILIGLVAPIAAVVLYLALAVCRVVPFRDV
jgi:hypothetical protein